LTTESPSINKDVLGNIDYKIHQIDAMIEYQKDRLKSLKEDRKYWAALYSKLSKLTQKKVVVTQ